MPTSTINPPMQHADTGSVVGYSYVFAQQEILLALQDRLSLEDMGAVTLVGDLVGTGSDTMRVTHLDGVGFDVGFDALANENSPITPKAVDLGYTSLTIAQYGLAHGETYTQQILGREPGVLLDQLKSFIVPSWMKTLRSLICTEIASFSTDVGSKSLALSVDDWIDLATVFNEDLGSGVRGAPFALIHPKQLTQSKASAENHPAYQNSLADWTQFQGADSRQVIDNFLGLGMRVAVTNDVNTSGGGYDGGAFSPGGVGWGRASTTPVRPANPQGAMMIPEFGLLIEELTDGSGTATRQYNARTWIGTAKGDSSVFTQRGLISTT